MNKELKLFVSGEVEAKDGRKFTKMCGSFGDDKPMFTVWQAGELLNLEAREITQNFERNESNFDLGIDFIDLKSAITQNDSKTKTDITKFLKESGYSQSRLNATKKWLTFSFSGMMKLVKIVENKESWKIYNNFLEDYFKTKIENENMKDCLEDQLKETLERKGSIYGKIILEKEEKTKFALAQDLEFLEESIRRLTSAIDNKEIQVALNNQIHLTESKKEYLTQADFGERFNNKIGSKTLGKLLTIVGISKRSKTGRTIPYQEFIPTLAYNSFNNNTLPENRDIDVAYLWNYDRCIKHINNWLEEHELFEKFYSITDKDILQAYITSLYDKYVLNNEEDDDQIGFDF